MRYCEAAALKKASSGENKALRRNKQSIERDLERKKEKLLSKHRELEAVNRIKEQKARAIKMYLDGRGPDPDGAYGDDDTDFDNVMIEIDENGLPRRDRLVLKRAENDRLEKQRKFLENEIRRKNAEVRRLEREAEVERQRVASGRMNGSHESNTSKSISSGSASRGGRGT